MKNMDMRFVIYLRRPIVKSDRMSISTDYHTTSHY